MDVLGNDLAADNQFRDIRDACFSGETLSNAILERIKNLAVCPILQAGAAAFNVPASDFMVSWTMTTQSIGEALANVAAAAEAEPAVLINSTLTTASLGVPLGLPFPGGADLYTGTIQIPYFMSKADPLFSTWQSASGLPISLDPNPVATEQLTIPLFAVIPNSTGCPAGKPVTGWPVTIYQHGVSRNRVDAFLLGEAFAAACTAIVAIDLPLHGVLDASNPFFQGPDNPVPFNAFGDNERHFYLDDFTIDIGGAGLIPGLPDGEVDDGTEVFAGAVLAPASGRDNFRQAGVRFDPSSADRSDVGPGQ